MTQLLSDLRFSLRTLIAEPVFTISAVLALALGLGANTAIFSLFESAVLNPLPVERMDRLTLLWMSSDKRGEETVPPADYQDWRGSTSSFEELAAYCFQTLNLTGLDLPEKVDSASVTANFFDALGVAPAAGRGLGRSDDGDDGRVVVLSHGFWQRRFDGDPAILGQTLVFDAAAYTVTGVMPQGFDFPEQVDVWTRAPRDIPILDSAHFTEPETNLQTSYLRVLGRLGEGTALAAAATEIGGIARRRAQELPQSNAGFGVSLQPLREHLVGDSKTMLLVLLGGVGIVLLIACVNVANLALARSRARRREMALRSVLGASRGRLMRQLLTESLLLAAVAGIAGLLVGLWMTRVLVAWFSQYGVRAVGGTGVSWEVLLFAFIITLLTGVGFGLAPALQLSKASAGEALSAGAMRSVGSRSDARWRDWLVGAEVAVVVVLLVGAGLTLRSFLALQQVEPGFNADGVAVVKIFLPTQKYAQGFERNAFFRDVQQRVEQISGVAEAAAVLTPPMANDAINIAFNIEGQSGLEAGERPQDGYQIVLPGYFETLRIPVLAGRTFRGTDSADGPGAVVISEAMAQRYWSDRDPVGQRITYGRADDPEARWLTIVGVVEDVHHDGLTAGGRAEVYQIHSQAPWPFLSFVVRARPGVDAMSLVPAVRREIAEIDPAQSVAQVHSLEDLVAESAGSVRVTSRLLAIFALLALALAAVGIYGVLAYGVSQRRREIGIRMALGAGRPVVLRGVLARGVGTAVVGAVLGLVVAFAGARVLRGLLYGVETFDPITYVVTPLILLTVATLASLIPAYRATRVDPAITLKAD